MRAAGAEDEEAGRGVNAMKGNPPLGERAETLSPDKWALLIQRTWTQGLE